jgi:SAM-dependent methyltransferase
LPDNEVTPEDSRSMKVDRVWGRHASARGDAGWLESVGWAEHPMTARHINMMVSGDPSVYWVDWAAHRWLKKGGRGLSLGSGTGYVERLMIERGYASAMDAVDISGEALAGAREAARGMAIEYRREDLNAPELSRGAYDFVISAAALHHVTNLERCLCEAHASLASGGLLVMHEFVGAARFQWSDPQLELVNRLHSELPPRYRVSALTGLAPSCIERRPLGDMILADPSEAVRSDEILDVASKLFEAVDVREIGGAVLHPLLEGTIGNYNEGDVLDGALLGMLIDIDRRSLEGGFLPADFAVWVGRARPVPQYEMEALMRAGDEKLRIITRQEEEILSLEKRLRAADEQTRSLAESCACAQDELAAVKREREKMLAELEALKSTGPFKTARYLKARLKK